MPLPRDENYIVAIGFVGIIDLITIYALAVNPVTHAVIVEIV